MMCKHVAAVLYGVGARLDAKPELLFLLRGVNHEELIEADAEAAVADATARGKSKRLAAGGPFRRVRHRVRNGDTNATAGRATQKIPKTRRRKARVSTKASRRKPPPPSVSLQRMAAARTAAESRAEKDRRRHSQEESSHEKKGQSSGGVIGFRRARVIGLCQVAAVFRHGAPAIASMITSLPRVAGGVESVPFCRPQKRLVTRFTSIFRRSPHLLMTSPSLRSYLFAAFPCASTIPSVAPTSEIAGC